MMVGWLSGLRRRVANPLRVFGRAEGSNPSPTVVRGSAERAPCGERGVTSLVQGLAAPWDINAAYLGSGATGAQPAVGNQAYCASPAELTDASHSSVFSVTEKGRMSDQKENLGGSAAARDKCPPNMRWPFTEAPSPASTTTNAERSSLELMKVGLAVRLTADQAAAVVAGYEVLQRRVDELTKERDEWKREADLSKWPKEAAQELFQLRALVGVQAEALREAAGYLKEYHAETKRPMPSNDFRDSRAYAAMRAVLGRVDGQGQA